MPSRHAAGLLAASTLLALGCGVGADDESSDEKGFEDARKGLSAELPPGWRPLELPITNVTYPRQVLAASSYPVRERKPTSNCSADAAMKSMPPEGALVQVIEYTTARDLSDFAVRPPTLRFSDGRFGTYECLGPGFMFVFREAGRALQAHVGFDRQTVSPEIKREALDLLNGLRFDRRLRVRRVYLGVSCVGAGNFTGCDRVCLYARLPGPEPDRLTALVGGHEVQLGKAWAQGYEGCLRSDGLLDSGPLAVAADDQDRWFGLPAVSVPVRFEARFGDQPATRLIPAVRLSAGYG